MNKPFKKTILALSLLLFLLGCSSPQKQYSNVQTKLSDIENRFNGTFDYAEKTTITEEAIIILKEFLLKNSEGNWSEVAAAEAANWELRKSAVMRERDVLLDQLTRKMKASLIRKIHDTYAGAIIRRTEIIDHKTKLEDNQIRANDTYKVVITSRSDYRDIELKVLVAGSLRLDTKQVAIGGVNILD